MTPGPEQNGVSQSRTDAAPGGRASASKRRQKVVPRAFILTDTSEQRSWPMHKYASKHLDIARQEWNLREGDYAGVLAADALRIAEIIGDPWYCRDAAAIRMEALALCEAAPFVCLIERKSLPDLVGTMTRGHDRFEDECERMRPYGFRAIVVESDLPSVIHYCETQSGARAKSVIGSIIAFQQRFGIHAVFGSDRVHASAYAFRLMERWLRDRADKLRETKP
jgi:ERCC4-type nuclease